MHIAHLNRSRAHILHMVRKHLNYDIMYRANWLFFVYFSLIPSSGSN